MSIFFHSTAGANYYHVDAVNDIKPFYDDALCCWALQLTLTSCEVIFSFDVFETESEALIARDLCFETEL